MFPVSVTKMSPMRAASVGGSEAPASFEGTYYRVENAYCAPQPNPIPPMMIGGGGEQKTLRLVAQYADWWNFSGESADTYAHKLDVLRKHCQAVGRNYDEIVKTWSAEGIAVAQTEAEAQRIAAASPYKKDVFIGTPAQIAEQLRAFVDLGAEYLIVRVLDFPDTAGVELFAHEVIPLLG